VQTTTSHESKAYEKASAMHTGSNRLNLEFNPRSSISGLLIVKKTRICLIWIRKR